MNNSVKKNYNTGPNSSVLYTPRDPQVLLTFNYHLPEPTQWRITKQKPTEIQIKEENGTG